MGSIFDLGETSITREYLEGLGFEPTHGGREFAYRAVGHTADGDFYSCLINYRKRNPNAPKGEHKHHTVTVITRIPDRFGSVTHVDRKTYNNIRYESELIGVVRAIEDEFGAKVLKDKYNPKYYWSNYVEEL